MTTILEIARREALFCASVPSTPLTKAQANKAVRASVRSHGGVRGCAGAVATEFGDHPDAAVMRMRWAIVQAEIAWGVAAVAA